jgi:hypothetical protein
VAVYHARFMRGAHELKAEPKMTRIVLAAAAIVAALSIEQRPAQASEAPWCVIGGQSGTEQCYYNSIEECTRSHGFGFCNPNPRYHAPQQDSRRPRGKR